MEEIPELSPFFDALPSHRRALICAAQKTGNRKCLNTDLFYAKLFSRRVMMQGSVSC
jgi:hypothetical protein